MSRPKKKKLKISLSNIHDSLVTFLISIGEINENEDVSLTIPVKAKDGIVEVTLERNTN